MTALDVITRALSSIRVYGAGATPSATDTADCLSALNNMLASWSINGIDLAPIPLITTDVLDVPDDHLEAICLSLAERVAGDFGAEVSPINQAIADQGRSAIRAYHFTIATIGIDHPAAVVRSDTPIL